MGTPFKHKVIQALDMAGLAVFAPVVRLCTKEEPRKQVGLIARHIVVPIVVIAMAIGAWSLVAPTVKTPYGQLPTPSEVWDQGGRLVSAWFETRKARREFEANQQAKAAETRKDIVELRSKAAASKVPAEREQLLKQAETREVRAARAVDAKFSSTPTYVDQIVTSLETVFAGFVIASLIAIPIGILCGLSATFMSAVSPFIAIFKPVSPLAWLPIVMIIVSAMYTADPATAWFEKSFLSSAITVALCSLWPTLVNTALGVASIDKDHMNVARVLRLGPWERVTKIVLPSSLPLIFTGLRLSLGVGWMVLIAAEMLAQNPGLGKFVWDMFQNGSSDTLAAIIVAVFTIGIIGFLLDRLMVVLQKAVSFDTVAV